MIKQALKASLEVGKATTWRGSLRRGHHGVVGFIATILFLLLALGGVEPIPTYFFVFAWYPAILMVDGLVVRRRGDSLLVDRPLALLSMFAWSVPFWLLFELVNLRVENWYYVGTPRDLLAGRVLLIASFATVLPALFELYDLLGTWRWFDRIRLPRVRLNERARLALFGVGWLMLLLTISFPTYAYALLWVFLVPLLEPFNRRPAWPSLIRDLEKGRGGRLVKLLLAGLLCGLYWEVMNMPARARWIYTVPFFDRTLGVEMPPLGFLGFAPFALEAYSFLRAMEICGLSIPFDHDPRRYTLTLRLPGWVKGLLLPVGIAIAGLLVIVGLERQTVDAEAPHIAGLQALGMREAAILQLGGSVEVDDLVSITENADEITELARRLLLPVETAQRIAEEARLVTLRGIGTKNGRLLASVGVHTVSDLAKRDAMKLYGDLRRLGDVARRVRPQRVRVWVRGARDATGLEE